MLAAVSLATVVVSVLLLAWQSYEVARQSRLQVKVAASGSAAAALSHLHDVQSAFIERPALRRYFYDNEPEPRDASPTQAQVAVIAEMLLDCLEVSLEHAAQVEASRVALAGWGDFTLYLLGNSPAMTRTLREHPAWYPRVGEMAKDLLPE